MSSATRHRRWRNAALAGAVLATAFGAACDGESGAITMVGPAAPSSTAVIPTTTAAPPTTVPPTTVPPTTVPPTVTTMPPVERIDATTPLSRGRFGPIRLGMTLAQVEALVGPVQLSWTFDDPATGDYCGDFVIPGADDVSFGVSTMSGGSPGTAVIGEISVYEGTRRSEFGVGVGDGEQAVLAAGVEDLRRVPHEYDETGAYLESDAPGGGFRFQVSEGRVTTMQTGGTASNLSVEGYCI